MSKAKRNPHIPRDRKRAVGAAIEAAIPQIAARVLARDASEALKAKADADAGKTMLQRQTERKAALKAKQDEIDRQVKEHLNATKDEAGPTPTVLKQLRAVARRRALR